MEELYKSQVTGPVHTGMDSSLYKASYGNNQVEELAGRMAGWVDDLDCGTWAVFSALEVLLVLETEKVK